MGTASRTPSLTDTISTSPSLPTAFVDLGGNQDTWKPPSHLSSRIIPSANEYFLSTYWVPGTVLGAGNAAVNKIDQNLCLD